MGEKVGGKTGNEKNCATVGEKERQKGKEHKGDI